MLRIFMIVSFSLLVFSSFDTKNVIKALARTKVVEPEYFIPAKYKEYVSLICNQYKVPIWIFARLINIESGWDRWKTNRNANHTTDKGIAMLNDAYMNDWIWFYNEGQKFDPFDPIISIRISVKHLAVLFRETGNWKVAVAAYNCGLTKSKTGKWPLRTRRYIEEIFEGGTE